MKKKRLIPMCLCLVLALGLAACDDLEDLLPSSGDDEMGDTSPTEPDDTGDDTEGTEPGGPSESVPTYSIEIVYPDGDISLEVGKSETIAVSLVTTEDNTDSRVAGTASEVTLYSSDSSVVSVEGLTITALTAGEAVITATWTEHGVTSSGLTVTVTAPVYTPTVEYSIAITSPSSGTSVLTNIPITIGVSLITTADGTPTSEEGSAETVELNISPETSSATIEGLTITDTVAETLTITATWIAQEVTSEPITITFVEPSPEAEITYGVTITNPTSETVLNVGSDLTIAATLYTYSDEAVSASEVATIDNVTVELDTSSTGSVDISGLTITGETAGSVTLIVTWGEYATSSVTFTVESVYTYAMEISNPTSSTSLEVGGTLDVSATLITYTDGTPTGSETATGSNVVVTQTGGTGSVEISGLTIKGVSAGEVTLTVTWGEYATKEVTFEVISVTTYGVKITSPSEGAEVEVGSTLTFTVDLITYTDGVETSRDTSVSSGVTLTQSSTDTGEVDINGLTITGKTAGEVAITATDTHGESDSITIIVTEPQAVFESYTITIQLKTSDGQAFPAPTGTYSVFINSEYDVDAWSSWGTHLMKYDETSDTYSYTYTSLPTSTSETHTANFYASTTADTSGIPETWSDSYLGYYMIPVTQDSVGTLSSGIQEITTSFTSWEGIFSGDTGDTATSRTNFSVTFYFVDNVENHSTYYSIPSYADGYVAGYFTKDSGSWDEPNISSGLYKMTANGGNASDGYTVTFPTILTGSRQYDIYFEHNGTGLHSADTTFSWSHVVGGDDHFTLTIPETGEAEAVYIATDPSTVIENTSDNAFTVTIGLSNSNASKTGNNKTFYLTGIPDWNTSTAFTSSSSSSYDQSVTIGVDKGSQFSIWIGGTTYSSSVYDNGLAAASDSLSSVWDAAHGYLWIDNTTWQFNPTNYSDSTGWNTATSLTIIYTFDFNALNSSSANAIVTAVSCSFS